MANDNDAAGKGPLQSKKFVAFLVGETTWKIALIVLLVLGMKEAKIDIFVGSIAMAIVIIAGALEALYIGGQAGLDRYTRIAQIAVNAGQGFEMKGVTLQPKCDAKKPTAETGVKEG